MMAWTEEELQRLAGSNDLHISPFREDGVSLGTPTWIWSVVVDGAVYVRPYHGERSRWFQAAKRQRAGQITAAGMTKDVSFELAPGDINARVDQAYRDKYSDSEYLGSMISARARAATVKVTPRVAESDRLRVAPALALASMISAGACAGTTGEVPPRGGESDVLRVAAQVAPALAARTRGRLFAEVWSRPGLSRRDRSLVTIAAMIARGQLGCLGDEFERALDNGLSPAEISETIVQLAYYAGWGDAMAATGPAGEVFSRRGVSVEQLPPAEGSLLPIDEAAEAQRAAFVEASFGDVSAGVVQYTTEALFRELWLRPGLAPRDRSVVTVSALIAVGQPAQVPFHLGKAMDNGLTRGEASELLTQLAFYAGWPRVFSALPVFKEVFAARG